MDFDDSFMTKHHDSSFSMDKFLNGFNHAHPSDLDNYITGGCGEYGRLIKKKKADIDKIVSVIENSYAADKRIGKNYEE